MPTCPKCKSAQTYFNSPSNTYVFDCNDCDHTWLDADEFWDSAMKNLYDITGEWISNIGSKPLPKDEGTIRVIHQLIALRQDWREQTTSESKDCQ